MDTCLERIRREELEGVKEWFRPGMRILELGGGSGFQAAILASWGCHVVSVDVAQKPSPGRQMFQKQYFPVATYDGLHLPFGDAAFDLVYSSNMLYHVLPLPEFLDEIQRVLRPGGVALHVIPSASWRWWTSLAHYIHLAGVVRRKLGRRAAGAASAPRSEPDNRPGPEPLVRRIRRLLRADPLGPYPSACHELFVFRRARWVAAFRLAGYEGIDPRPNGLFYTGYLLCPGCRSLPPPAGLVAGLVLPCDRDEKARNRGRQSAAMSDAGTPVRVLALMDAHSVTGPAKNLIEFAGRALHPPPGLPAAEIRLATLQRGSLDPPNAYVAAVRQAGLPIDVIPEKGLFDFGVVPRLRAVVERYRPDIIQTHHYKLHFLIRFSGLYRQAAWLAFHHGYTTTNLLVRCYNQLDRWSLQPARRIVTVCRPFALELERLGIAGSRISIRHNSILPFVAPPAGDIAALRARLGVPGGAKVILTVGRLSKEKGHQDLLEAAAALRRSRPSLLFRLILAGEGPERGRIERRIADLGLTDAVIMAGHQADVRPYYAMADAFVLPSHSEGSPNVLLEAMSAGIPTVAAAVGGVPEIARDGDTALLVGRGDYQAMAGGMARILEDRELALRLGSAARRVTAGYTPDAYCRSLLTIYQQLLQVYRT